MHRSSLLLDGFLDDFDQWRTWFDGAQYGDVASDVDAVTYPGICKALPDELRDEIAGKLKATAGVQSLNWLFARLSLEGTSPPHWAHHDGSMGEYSMMLYVNRPEHCRGGTALLRHRQCGDDVPEATWRADTNLPERWTRSFECTMHPNRAFIFPARQWHAALPFGGFGTSPRDGRLVVTAFFS